jgi:hypothetical protein
MTPSPLTLTAAELAYVFSYLRAGAVIGWPAETFAPPAGNPDPFFAAGRDGLLAKRLIRPDRQPGRHRFDDDFVRWAVALTDPSVVVQAQRREGEGARLWSGYARGATVVETTRDTGGRFVLVGRESLAGLAGSAAAWVDPSPAAPTASIRLEVNRPIVDKLRTLSRGGKVAGARPALIQLGATPAQADSALSALATPARGGTISLLYCAGNRVMEAEVYSVLTNAAGESWLLFSPAQAAGPVVLERTALAPLAARLLVTLSTWLAAAL